jgi:hypothetical protein
MNPELLHFHEQVVNCTRPEDLFGQLVGDVVARRQTLRLLYRRFALIAHVDRYQRLDEQRLAHVAFIKLNELHQQALDALDAGTYGTSRIVPKKSATPPTMRSKRGLYVVGDGLARGDLSNVYHAEFDGKEQVLLKVARHHALNDLLKIESMVLTGLNVRAAGTTSYKHFIPTLLDSFAITVSSDNSLRQVNVLKPTDAEFRSLVDVFLRYPDGIDQRHFVWMFNRLLTTLSFIHSQGMIHGAVLPPHVLIQPTSHAIHLIDWCFSTTRDRRVIAISDGYKGWYPPEVLERRSVTSATDIYMAAMTMCYVLGADFGEGLHKRDVHPKFRRLLESCLLKNQARRPQSAWELFKELNVVAQDVLGERRYIKLEMSA